MTGRRNLRQTSFTDRQLGWIAAAEACLLLFLLVDYPVDADSPPHVGETSRSTNGRQDFGRTSGQGEHDPGERVTSRRETRTPANSAKAEVPGSSLSGRVVDARGESLPAGLFLRKGEATAEARAGEGGYAVVGLEPGIWQVWCRAAGHVVIERSLEIAGPHTRHDFQMTAVRAVPVYILGADDEPYVPDWSSLGLEPPVPDARFPGGVLSTTHPTPHRLDREWHLQSLARLEKPNVQGSVGQLINQTSLPLHVTYVLGTVPLATTTWHGSDDAVRIRLSRDALRSAFAWPSLTIVDSRSGLPVPNSRLHFGWPGYASFTCDTSGQTTVGPITPGPVAFSAVHGEGRSKTLRTTLHPGDRRHLRLEAFANLTEIRGTVSGPDGTPPGTALITYRDVATLDAPATEWAAEDEFQHTEPGGRFELRLPAGRYLIRAHDYQNGSAARVIDVTASAPRDVNLRMQPVHPIDLQLSGPAYVSVGPRGGLPVVFRRLRDSGVLHAPAGTWQLSVTYPDGRMVSKDITLPRANGDPVDAR